MKLAVVMLMVTVLQASATAYSQERLTLNYKQVGLERLFEILEKKSNYTFFYKDNVIPREISVDVMVRDLAVPEILDSVLKSTDLSYTVLPNKLVVIMPREAAQKYIKIAGKVTSESGETLVGVTVKVKGSDIGTVTDSKGNYHLTVPENSVLEVSYIGYEKTEVPVTGETIVNIILKASNKGLNQVVVVAYGTEKKVSVVGSQATINPLELKIPVRNLTNALAGRVAGIVAVQRSGEPGYDASSIFIRGISTFASSPTGPLIVVDGVPDRPIDNIDPEDIQSFTILKDASATAVYGTRGANGVILVYTKRGKPGPPHINAEVDEGISQFTQLPKFVDAPTFMNLFNEGLTMRGRTPQYSQDEIAKHASGSDPDLYPNVDWYKVMFNRFGSNNRANLNVTGGSNTASYYISAGYYNEVGLFKRDKIESYNSAIKYQRFNFTSNVDVQMTKTTKLQLGVNGFIYNGNYPGTGTSTLFYYATAAPPHTIPPRYSNGQWPKVGGTIGDPYMFLTASGYATEFGSTVRSNIRIKQDLGFLLKGLSGTSMFAFDNISQANLQRTRTPSTYLATGRDSTGQLITQLTDQGTDLLGFGSQLGTNRRFYTETGLNYNNDFGQHSVAGMLLYNQSDFVDGGATNLISSIPYRQRGLTGRVTYGFREKYFMEGNFGYTGSENFAPGHRFGFFPSIGAAWVVSNEKFFEPLKNIISYFKLRYSDGLSGNSNTNSRFLFLTQINGAGGYRFGEPGNYTDYNGQVEGQVGSDVTWETARRRNLGIELNTFHDDLQLIVELFKERRHGILLRNYTIPYASGYRVDNIPYGNIGITENKGIDISLSYNKTFERNSFVAFRGSFNYNVNKDVYDGLPPWQYPWLNRTGHPIGQRFGYIALGLFKDSTDILASPQQSGDVRPGDIKYKDINGDGIINSYDQVPIGYGSIPRIVYGLNFAFGYRGFDLSLFFQGVGMVDFNYSGGFATVPFSQGATYGNLYTTVMDRWTPAYGKDGSSNQQPFYPRMSTNQDQTTNYYTSTWWIKRADYLRLKTAELGYNFDLAALKRFKVSKMRVFLNGTNLFTISAWKFWDPELGDGTGAQYPNITVYNAGVRISFN